MKTKIIIGIISFMFCFSCVLLADNGKQLFIQYCLNCHREGGKADPINPADKAGRVWVKYFKRKRHENYEKLLSTIGEDKLNKIINYLKENAADSDHPEAAVIPK